MPLEKWLKMYPDLNGVLPFRCSCGKELEAKPYVSSEWMGLESTECDCDLKDSFCSGFPRDKEENKKAREILINL